MRAQRNTGRAAPSEGELPGTGGYGPVFERPYTEVFGGPAFIFNNGGSQTIFTGYGGPTTVVGSDQDTNLICWGPYDVTSLFGNSRNIAFGNVGNDMFVGGAGSNLFYGGAGNDVLIGGSGDNRLNGGAGNDTLMAGQWDEMVGGAGADRFIFAMKAAPAGSVFVRDLSFKQGDTLDLTMMPEVTRGNIEVRDDALVCHAPGGDIFIQGVGFQLEIVGGIDAAIAAWNLSVFGDYGGKG